MHVLLRDQSGRSLGVELQPSPLICRRRDASCYYYYYFRDFRLWHKNLLKKLGTLRLLIFRRFSVLRVKNINKVNELYYSRIYKSI